MTKGLVVGQAQVNLIDDGETATRLHHLVDARQLVRRNGGACRVGRRGQQHTTGFFAPVLRHLGAAELVALRGIGGDQARHTIGTADKVAVARVAGIGHEHFIARIHQRQARQLQRSAGPGSDDDALGGNVQTKALRIPPADGLAQRGQAQRVGVLRGALGNRGLCGMHHGGRGGEVGLANIEKDHGFGAVGHLGCQGLGGLGDFHDIKGLNLVGARSKLHGGQRWSKVRGQTQKARQGWHWRRGLHRSLAPWQVSGPWAWRHRPGFRQDAKPGPARPGCR